MNPRLDTSATQQTCATAGTEARAPQSVIPESVPHFTSFDHITDPRLRRAKEYEQYLLFTRDRFPEYADRLKGELDWAHAQSQRSQPSDRDVIFAALDGEELTRSEIAEDTGIPAVTIYKHLKNLMELGLVSQTRRPGIGNNRFILIYSQTHTRP